MPKISIAECRLIGSIAGDGCAEETLYNAIQAGYLKMGYDFSFIFKANNASGHAHLITHLNQVRLNVAFPRSHPHTVLLDMMHELAHLVHYYPKPIRAKNGNDWIIEEVTVERAALAALEHFLGDIDVSTRNDSVGYVNRKELPPEYQKLVHSRTHRLKKKMIAFLEEIL